MFRRVNAEPQHAKAHDFPHDDELNAVSHDRVRQNSQGFSSDHVEEESNRSPPVNARQHSETEFEVLLKDVLVFCNSCYSPMNLRTQTKRPTHTRNIIQPLHLVKSKYSFLRLTFLVH